MIVTAPIQTYFSPDDDLKTIFLNFVSDTETEFKFADYGFHMPMLTDVLLHLHESGKTVGGVLDHTQEEGKYEHPEVQKLLDAKLDIAIGTSFKHHIMHDKYAVRDGRYVLAGSWNFSESATLESNFFFIVDSPELARLFLTNWQEQHEWISTHEQKYQEAK